MTYMSPAVNRRDEVVYMLHVGGGQEVACEVIRFVSARTDLHGLTCSEDCLGRIIANDQRLDFMEHGLIEIGHADSRDLTTARIEEAKTAHVLVLLGVDGMKAHEPVHANLQRMVLARLRLVGFKVPDRVLLGQEITVVGVHDAGLTAFERDAVSDDWTVLLEEGEASLDHDADVVASIDVRADRLRLGQRVWASG